MPEACVICIDNSEHTRNGDYAPTRFESQTDAVNLVCGAKTQQNPENSVGLLTSAGDRVEVMVTPTTDLGKLVTELARISIGGSSDLLRAIQTAQLSLKHLQGAPKQRIIAFVGSPVVATDKELETLGKSLRKNNVSLDLVSFGEVEENMPKLEKLLGAVNSNDNSHMVEVPVGPKLLSDVLLSSVIISPDGAVPGAAAGGGGGDFEFGINPNDDPELALALRISMEEERARQAAAGGGVGEGAAAPGEAPASQPAAPAAGDAGPDPTPAAAPTMPVASEAAVIGAMDMDDMDMDEELRQALLLSMQEAEPAAAAQSAPAAPVPPAAADGDSQMASVPEPTADAAPAAVAETAAAPSTGQPAGSEAAVPGEQVDSKWFQDPSFVEELLGSLPGVDINDPRIQMALKEVGDEKKDEEGAAGSGNDNTSAGSGDKDASKGGQSK